MMLLKRIVTISTVLVAFAYLLKEWISLRHDINSSQLSLFVCSNLKAMTSYLTFLGFHLCSN